MTARRNNKRRETPRNIKNNSIKKEKTSSRKNDINEDNIKNKEEKTSRRNKEII